MKTIQKWYWYLNSRLRGEVDGVETVTKRIVSIDPQSKIAKTVDGQELRLGDKAEDEILSIAELAYKVNRPESQVG